MIKKIGPYIGVTGFMSKDEVNEALKIVPDSGYYLMVGVLMSSKTLGGRTNKWPNRYPKKESISNIFINSQKTLNLIHYSTDQPEMLCQQLMTITKLAGPHLDGFQLNMAWPPHSELRMYYEAHPEKILILQIGNKALLEIESLERFRELLEFYQPMISGVLIDESGGTGKLLDINRATYYLQAASEVIDLQLGVAGGLHAKTLDCITPLAEKFPGLSIDAEGGLRTPQPEDRLCIKKMVGYIQEAYLLLDDHDNIIENKNNLS